MMTQRFAIGSSIYRRMILSLLIVSLVFFTILAAVIFNVTRVQTENTVQQWGSRVSIIINRALQKSMLINDNSELLETMLDLTRFSGIERINVFDQEGSLKHSTSDIDPDQNGATIMDALDHFTDDGLSTPTEPINYLRSVSNQSSGRILSVLTPIRNEKRCWNNNCHVHTEEDLLLGVLSIELSLAEIDKYRVDTEIKYFIMVTLFIMGAIFIIVIFTKRTIYKPMSEIVHASSEVAKGNTDIRIPVESFNDSDMLHVGSALNDMLEKLGTANSQLRLWSKDLEEKVRVKTEEIKRTQNELIHIERMASLGKLSSSVAHEINNPLAGVLTYTKLVSKILKRPEVSPEEMNNIYGYLSMIESETVRCGNIVKGLLDFSRDEPRKMETISVNKVLTETQTLMKHAFKVGEIDLVTDFSAFFDTMKGNSNQIKQCCIAILVNAIEACGKEGRVVFTSSNTSDMKDVIITISDTGHGIRDEDLNRIYDPFFSRKKEGSATGLGLAVAYGIVQQHHGTIVVDTELAKGTSFKMTFPTYNVKEGEHAE